MSEQAYIRQFANLTDWLNYSENPSSNDGPPETCESQNINPSWSGVQNKAESYTLMRKGHPEGLKAMQRILDGVRNAIKLVCPQYEFHNGLEGCAPNVEAFIQGLPEDMVFLSPVDADAPPSELTLQIEMCFACYISPHQAMFAGATVFTAMEALRAQGCNTRILMTHTVSRYEDYWQSSVPVPNNIDLDTLSFLFTHPCVLRTLIFSIMEHEESYIRQKFNFYQGRGYSRPAVRKNPHANLVLRMAKLCQMFYGNFDLDVLTAQNMMQVLVDTKFESMQKQ